MLRDIRLHLLDRLELGKLFIIGIVEIRYADRSAQKVLALSDNYDIRFLHGGSAKLSRKLVHQVTPQPHAALPDIYASKIIREIFDKTVRIT